MNVSIIVTNYNGAKRLSKNLPSVIAAKANPKNRIVEIIVADDFSTDNSKEIAESLGVKFVKTNKNSGFSVNVNNGVKNTKGDLVCVLNDDVSPEWNFLQSVYGHFEDKSVFAVTLHEKGRGPAVGKFEDGFIGHELGLEGEKLNISFWASGGSSVFRKSYWNKLGGLDDELLSPYYWEDIDIGYRAWKRGWRILWDPKALVLHEPESTFKKLDQKKLRRIQERNQLLYIWKNLTSPILFRRHVAGIVARLAKHPGYIRVVIMALIRLPKVVIKRKIEKKQSKVSDESIFALFK